MGGPTENKALDVALGRKLETKALRRTVASTAAKFAHRWGLKAAPIGGAFAIWPASVPGAREPVTRAELLEVLGTLETLLNLLASGS